MNSITISINTENTLNKIQYTFTTLKIIQTWNKCSFLIQFKKKPVKSIGNNVLNSDAPLETVSLKSGTKQELSSLFNIGLKILTAVIRHEAKLIVIVTGKETKLLFVDDQGCLSKPKKKAKKKNISVKWLDKK